MLIKQKDKKTKLILLSLGAALLVVIAGTLYFIRPHTATPTTSSTPTVSTKDAKSTANSTASSSGSITTSKDPAATTQPVPQPTSGATPQTPTGTFVSNHHPNLSGSPAPNLMNSTCTTTAGMYCRITFANNGTTVSLPSKQADANGNATWTWKLQDIGATEGSWTVTAVATNDDKTVSAVDPMTLEVRP